MTTNSSFFTTTAVLFVCFALIIIIFSSMIIIIIITNWQSQCRSITNLLACNSCAALLFFALTISIQIPFIIQNDLLQSHTINTTFCKTRGFLLTFATSVKTYSYLIQAISRFFITILHKHRFLRTFHVNWTMVITSWIISGIIAGGMLISPVAYQYEPESRLCFISTKVFLTSCIAIVIIFFVTVDTVIVLYGIILWHSTRYRRIHPNSTSTLRAKRNIQVFKKILIFISILVVGGTPYLLSVILNVIDKAPWRLYSISVLFIALSAAIESIALLFTNEQVKKIFFTKVNVCQKNGFTLEMQRTNKVSARTNHMNLVTTLPIVR
jgi:hypothetical protein